MACRSARPSSGNTTSRTSTRRRAGRSISRGSLTYPPLYPADPAERERALALEEFFDEEAGHELRRAAFFELRDDLDFVSAFLATGRGPMTRRLMRILATLPGAFAYARHRYRIYPDDAEEGRAKVVVALDRIVAEVQPSGYLVGSTFTVADLTAASLLFPLAWPAELQYPYPDPPQWGAIEALTRHPAIDWIREMYRRHRGTSAAISG